MTIDLAPALRVLGYCAITAAVTTFLNTIAPHFYSADSFEGRAALIHHPVYMARQWVLLVHPAFTLMLALGMALALFSRAPGKAAGGLLFASVEKMTEFLLGVTILFVVNGVWKVEFLEAMGSPAADRSRGLIEVFNQLLDGCYFLLWSMFILSTALLSAALSRTNALERWIVATAGLTILLTILMMLGEYAGQSGWTGPIVEWLYSPALTLHRLLIGLWLLSEARRRAQVSAAAAAA